MYLPYYNNKIIRRKVQCLYVIYFVIRATDYVITVTDYIITSTDFIISATDYRMYRQVIYFLLPEEKDCFVH